MQNRLQVQAFWACASGRCRPRAATTAGALHNANFCIRYKAYAAPRAAHDQKA
jgi:hypothetical protein